MSSRLGPPLVPWFLAASLMGGTPARAEEPSKPPVPWTVESVLVRVEGFHPQVRARMASGLRAQVDARRARWNRVAGVAGLAAGYGLEGQGLASTGSVETSFPPTWADGFAGRLFADLRVPLYAGGAISSGIERADARLEAATQDIALGREEVKQAALVSYAAAAASERSLGVARAARERASALARLAQDRRETGVGTAADVARSQLNLLRREDEFLAREGDRTIAYAALRAALVLPENEPLALADSIERVAHHAERSPGTFPELVRDQARVKAAEAEVVATRAELLPRLDWSASAVYGAGVLGFTPGSLGLAPTFPPPALRAPPFAGSVATGATLTWRGFDFFVVRDRVAQAEQGASEARALLSETERVVQGRRADARGREAKADARVGALRAGVTVAEEAIRLARSRYETGNGLLSEVLDAELDAISVQASLVQATYDLAVAHVDRLRAEGNKL